MSYFLEIENKYYVEVILALTHGGQHEYFINEVTDKDGNPVSEKTFRKIENKIDDAVEELIEELWWGQEEE